MPSHPQNKTTKRKSNQKEKSTLSNDIDKTTRFNLTTQVILKVRLLEEKVKTILK